MSKNMKSGWWRPSTGTGVDIYGDARTEHADRIANDVLERHYGQTGKTDDTGPEYDRGPFADGRVGTSSDPSGER